MTLLKILLIALFLVGTQLTVACGGSDTPPPAEETEATDDGAAETEASEEDAVEE